MLPNAMTCPTTLPPHRVCPTNAWGGNVMRNDASLDPDGGLYSARCRFERKRVTKDRAAAALLMLLCQYCCKDTSDTKTETSETQGTRGLGVET